MKDSRIVQYLGGGMMLLLGFFFVWASTSLFANNIWLYFTGVEADGIVVDVVLEEGVGRKSRDSYCPVIEYVGNKDGETHLLGPKNVVCNSAIAAYEAGDVLTMAYNEDNPENAVEKSLGALLLSIVAVILPFLAIGVGILLLVSKPV